ncbi:molybdopterin-guanine dinucleotide biosynthesis protein B [Cytobacillus firmus]|uniref:Molybdopterin-guanine dinucleotide biosynthesis protein B n=2 Tax=Cytobacillus TaxID=2675230 RepID=A0A366JTD9_CYTFI|nr:MULTISPECIES: molybdopterin-guanine dinucleotide biosynthesis protein B [Cytobacillus]RBP92228.1 molybdopterin-guanine dinucleotide biosynthesis protein B [Cytobacillus firmus]TDX42087.1 molybdopterin-guanine dinucleotide biosynthesis protein B [Cytobacillus oceanisediminis]
MAMVSKAVIFQVSGYQNSGKTTLVSKIISGLKRNGLSAVTIKHHGHGGKPETPEGKDSSNHIESGAAASIVEGGGRLLLQAEKKSWSLDEQIKIAMQLHPDVVLIEGHKKASYPKALLLRSDEDMYLMEELTNICALFSWEDKLIKHKAADLDTPFFSIHDPIGTDWIIEYLVSESKKRK